MTNDVAASADGNADGAAAESRLVVALDDWDGSRAEIGGRRDATTGGKAVAASSRELFFVINFSKFSNVLTKQRETKRNKVRNGNGEREKRIPGHD